MFHRFVLPAHFTKTRLNIGRCGLAVLAAPTLIFGSRPAELHSHGESLAYIGLTAIGTQWRVAIGIRSFIGCSMIGVSLLKSKPIAS